LTGPGELQSEVIARQVQQKLGVRNIDTEREILTQIHDLFRTGHLAWGYNLANPGPPFCHVTDRGKRLVARAVRDPSNIDGYLQYISLITELDDVTTDYVREALHCYLHDLPKATAVMIGAANENLLYRLRDDIKSKYEELKQPVPKAINAKLAGGIAQGIRGFCSSQDIDRDLGQSVEAIWGALEYAIRTTRNDAGHPERLTAVDFEHAEASLLVFPEILRLFASLGMWVKAQTHFK